MARKGTMCPSSTSSNVDSRTFPPTLSEEMRPVLWILNLLTITPVSIEGGNVVFSWRSFSILWAVTSYVCMSAYAVYVFSIKLSDLFVESRTFSDAVFFCTFLELLHHHFVSPFVHWPEASSLATYFQSWTNYQIEFQKATGTPLDLQLRSRAWLHFSLTLAVPAILCVALLNLLTPIRSSEVLPFISTGMFFAIMPRTWDLFTRAVLRAEMTLRTCFEVELAAAKSESEAVKTVRRFRRLWTMLRRLAEAPGACWGVTTIHFLLYCLVTLLMSAFGVLTALPQGTLSRRGEALLLLVVDNLSHAQAVCTAGYISCHVVSKGMTDKLLELRLVSENLLLREEVGLFLRVIQDSSRNVCLSGFLTLDRVLFCSMASVVSTYLCVLAQFGAAVNNLYE